MDCHDHTFRDQRFIAFDALLLAVIIETGILQLRIAAGCSELRREVRGSSCEGFAALNQAKLEKDRALITEVLRTTLVELLEGGRWLGLKQAVVTLTQQSVALDTLKLENDCFKLSRISRSRELKTKRKVWQHSLRISDNKITILRDCKEEVVQNARMRLAYADKWLNGRSELLDLKSRDVSKQVPKTDHEDRVHYELCKAYEIQIQEREKLVELWRIKYAADTSWLGDRLAKRREQLKEAMARRDQLQKMHDLHAEEIRSWLTIKKERAARLALEERVRQAATRVQAWWRGVMVRRALGAYRNLKNNAKKPSAKNKKK